MTVGPSSNHVEGNRMKLARTTLLSTCISALFSANPAAAQVPAPGAATATIPAITVTAQKRTELLQDVPISETVLTPETLDLLNITNVNALQAAVPNILFLNVGSSNTVTAYIRGIGTANAVFSQDPAIGLYVDDVYLTRSLGANRYFFYVERIDVLRGPQGTLYGSNSPAGAIKIVTVKPSLTKGFQFKGEVGYGKYNEREADVALNIPIVENRMAARLVVVTGDTTRNRDIPTNGVSFLTTPAGGDAFNTPGFNKRDFFSEISHRYDNVDNHGITVNLHGRLPWGDFRSISAYRKLEEKLNQDVDATILNRFTAHQELDNKQFTQEFNLGGDMGPVNWLVGAYYIHEKNNFLWDVNFLQYLPTSVQAANGLLPNFQLFDQVKEGWAVFTQETWKVTDRLNLTGGVRWTHESKDFHAVGFRETAPVTEGTPPGTPLPGFDVRQEKSWSAPQWRVAADYALTPDALVFASAARGFRSGGFNGGARSLAEAVAPPFDPEFATTYELGAKTEWFQRRLRANAGFEFELLARPIAGLTLMANLATLTGSTNSLATQFAPNPKYQYTLAADYTQPVGYGLVGFIGANYFHTARYEGSATHDPLRAVPAHSNLGARIGVGSDNGRWRFEVIGNNLENNYYPLFSFNIPPLMTQVRFPNEPLTVMARLTVNF
ncbi:MAG: TonB-dependent receptor [Betaproteobacteria bacterium]|nr:MAG: TonB-dependent receptor [Betaproteobacteria bacterium]